MGILVEQQGNGGYTGGVKPGAIPYICGNLTAQTNRDGWPWAKECVTDGNNNILRILSPNIYRQIDTSAWNGYWEHYVDQVWSKYSSQSLTVKGTKCQVSNNMLNCGNQGSFAKPSTADIFSCSLGPFKNTGSSIVPALCAAFVRSECLLNGGDVEPSLGTDQYYTVDTTDHSKTVHENQWDGVGYTFSYDDVYPPNGQDASGIIQRPNPYRTYFLIGGT